MQQDAKIQYYKFTEPVPGTLFRNESNTVRSKLSVGLSQTYVNSRSNPAPFCVLYLWNSNIINWAHVNDKISFVLYTIIPLVLSQISKLIRFEAFKNKTRNITEGTQPTTSNTHAH
jgi:hypothetical protein